MAVLSTSHWVPQSEAEKDAVYKQLDKLFAHPTFKSSKRCPAFLRYIVDHQVRGDTQQLKERTIGVEVFGRSADYDTSADPVVRTTASEVRKRIAQYYQELGHDRDIRIELPLGSYTAEFHLPPTEAVALEPPSLSVPPPAAPPEVPRPVLWRNKKYVAFASVAALAVIVVASLALMRSTPAAVDQFWRPVISSQSPTLVCVNTWDMSGLVQESNPNSRVASGLLRGSIDLTQWLPISDAVAFSQITGFFGTLHSAYRVQGSRSTTLSDLMQAPSVLIGIFGNPWTQRVTDPLRFHFTRDDQGRAYIADAKDPAKRYYLQNGQGSGGTRDYAVVGRVFNSATGQASYVVAGLDAPGTMAGSEFITSPRYIEYLRSEVPALGDSKNVEALISVEVIDGRPGAPHIEASESW